MDAVERLPDNPRLRAILAHAEEIARQAGLKAVGAEHVQLAILHDAGAIPTKVIQQLGWEPGKLAERLQAVLTSPGYTGRVA
ncbi:Clp protease N-terminal domain-containing protein [Nocardia sp. NPDC050435]|uniref:Clp protease N-terminal domain-containing protein n=1 Tax=Nocardia sp. NPDC050435 TaxID=3155040 RepID=UPI0033F02EF4